VNLDKSLAQHSAEDIDVASMNSVTVMNNSDRLDARPSKALHCESQMSGIERMNYVGRECATLFGKQ